MSYDLSEASSDLELFFLLLHSWKNKYKTSVISAACVVENSPSGLGFPLTQHLDILEILLLLLLGYFQENACVSFGWVFHAKRLRCWKGERATNSQSTVWCLFGACLLRSHSLHGGILSETLFLLTRYLVEGDWEGKIYNYHLLPAIEGHWEGEGRVTGGDRGGKEGERAGEKEYGVDEPLRFPVTVKMLSKLK